MGDLGRRVAVAAVGIPLGIGLVYLGGWVFTVLVAALAVAGTLEVYGLAQQRGGRPFPWLGVPVVFFLVVWALPAGTFGAWAPGAMLAFLLLGLGSLTAAIFRRGPEGNPLLAAGTTLLGVAYAGAPMAFAVLLREFPEPGAAAVVSGRGIASMGGAGSAGGIGVAGAAAGFLVVFPLVATWMGDTLAYFVGSRWGRRKLIPAVSPAKTVEGGIGGLAGSVGGAVLYALLFLGPDSPFTLGIATAAVLGLLIGAVAQVGDLAESVLKREAGVKDSGAILPGHGGVLDRFDGVYFTLPLTYLLLALVFSA